MIKIGKGDKNIIGGSNKSTKRINWCYFDQSTIFIFR